MNGARVRAVVEREVLDLRRNKMVLVSMLLLPLLMVAIVAASLLAVGGMLSGELAAKGFVPPPELAGVDLRAAVAVLINDQNMLYLILTPTLLPVVIGAYSIIGEKEAKSLEPLLATPLRTGELVLGKAVAALVPAVVIGLVQFALAIGTIALLSPPGVVEHALRPLWIVGIFGAMPLLAALSTLLAVVVSARVADVRTAQAIASLVILPVVATGVAVLVGQIYLTVGVMAVACAVLAALDVGVWWLAVRTFGRESILSRVG